MDERLQQIGEKALTDSVVRLVWQVPEENADEFVAMKGTGFFIDTNLIVTNIHGVAGGVAGAPALIAERVSSETEFPVEGVVASDLANDLVILKVKGEGVPLSLGDSDTVRIGDTVCAVGHPHGEKGGTTQGTIHGIQASDKHFEVKAAFDPGQSGSPLLNGTGEVIGIVRAASIVISGPGVRVPSFSYAIPARALVAMLAEIAETEPLEEWQKQPRIRGYAEGVQGQIKMMQQKHEAAIGHFDAALELNPDLVEIYINRGALKIFRGKAEESIVDWDAAIKFNPDFFPFYVNRAAANLSVNQYEAAIADCNTVLELNPDFFQVYTTRADAKSGLKDYQGAIGDYDKVIELTREDGKTDINPGRMTHLINAYTNRGRVKRLIGDYEGAIADSDQALQLKDKQDSAFLYYNRAYAKRLLGQSKTLSERITLYQEAIDDYTEAITLSPKLAIYYNNRGVAKYHLGRSKADQGDNDVARKHYQEAVEDYTEAIKIDPKHRLAYHERGRAKEALGQHEAAKADFAKAKELET